MDHRRGKKQRETYFLQHTHTHTHFARLHHMCRFFIISQNAPKTLDCSTLFEKFFFQLKQAHDTTNDHIARIFILTFQKHATTKNEKHTRWRLNSRTSRSPNSRKRSLCSIKMATGPSRRKSSVRYYLSRVIACRVVNNSPSLSNRIGGVVCSRFGPFSLSLFPLVVSRLFSFSIALSRVAKKTRGTRPMAQREREREREIPRRRRHSRCPFGSFKRDLDGTKIGDEKMSNTKRAF